MSTRLHNRAAWDRYVENGNPWTVPVSPELVASARQGKWDVLLTPTIPVPKDWFPSLEDCDLLCLASGGGQQGPILAAVGANVTVFDNSPLQLQRDRQVSERDNLPIKTIEGDMADLGVFDSEAFDLVFHPISNCFVPEILPVWREAHRVLRRGGTLLVGFVNPVLYLFDDEDVRASGELVVKCPIPYSDVDRLSEAQKAHYAAKGEAFEFGHTLENQIGGLLREGFVLTGFYEDRFPAGEHALSRYISTFCAARAMKPRAPDKL